MGGRADKPHGARRHASGLDAGHVGSLPRSDSDVGQAQRLTRPRLPGGHRTVSLSDHLPEIAALAGSEMVGAQQRVNECVVAGTSFRARRCHGFVGRRTGRARRRRSGPMTTLDSLKVLVIGAGVGGISVARALLRDGHDVTVVERRSDMRPGGGSVTIWPTGSTV